MGEDIKISIVMSFYNRQDLLDRTIESIEKSDVKDYELIIVDDASDTPVVCPRANKIIIIEKKDKWYHNPCIPYNMGFRAVTGNVIVIQNPECYHVGDVLSYIKNNIKEGLYLSFACYAINKAETEQFARGVMPKLEQRIFGTEAYNGWYNHAKYRPKAYHFCSAITRHDMERVGGFDEKYAHGVAFDDDDLIRRVRKLMRVDIVYPPYVIHQYHHHFSYEDIKVWRPLHKRNQDLYNNG